MRPRWEEIEKENPWLETEYYDIDKNKDMAERYSVKDDIPVFVFLDSQGGEILRLSGERSKDELLDIINDNKTK